MKQIALFVAVFIFTICGLANAQTVSPEQLKKFKDRLPAGFLSLDKELLHQFAQQSKKEPASQGVPLNNTQGYSYKTQIFFGKNYTVQDVLSWLPAFISQLPPAQQPLFQRAREILAQHTVPHAPRQPAELTQTAVFAQWTQFLKSAKPHVLNAKEGNPFSLPDLQKARVILIGEDHTMHYPAEQLVEYLIAYNKSAPQSQRITHLFVEFAYQANIAMEFIRAHMGELPEKELLKQAVQYARQQLKNKYIAASLREEVRWLRLGYRLLQENMDVVFYAYDIPSSAIEKRNAAAMAFLQAGYQQPGTKMVVIGGALHMLRENLNTPLLGDSEINAQNSLAHTPGIAPQDIVSILTVGGAMWKDDLARYSGNNAIDLYHLLLYKFQQQRQNLAFKTPAKKFGFDYYFYFDSTKKPQVTDANNW